jgi:hypothetical protein
MAEKIEVAMEDRIDKAIQEVLAQSFRTGGIKVEDCLKASQSILNLAHARQLLSSKK